MSSKFLSLRTLTETQSDAVFIKLMFASAAVLNCIAAFAVAYSGEGPVLLARDEASEQVWDSFRLLTLCLIGATCGTMAKLAWRPTDSVNTATGQILIRLLAAKAVISMVCGLIVTPVLLRYMEWRPEPDVLVFLSGVVAFTGDVTIAPLLTLWQQWLLEKERQIRGDSK